MENSQLRRPAPTSVNATVGRRGREYLTEREVERLIEAAKQNRSCPPGRDTMAAARALIFGNLVYRRVPPALVHEETDGVLIVRDPRGGLILIKGRT